MYYCSRAVVYVTELTHHFSVVKGLRVIGLGNSSLRTVRHDAAGRMDTDDLQKHIMNDINVRLQASKCNGYCDDPSSPIVEMFTMPGSNSA